MRTVLIFLLTFALAGPVLGQSDTDEWRTFAAGTWAQPGDAPSLRLAIDTTADTDTLRLTRTGTHAPRGLHEETIACGLDWPAAGTFVLTGCPRTTLARLAPPRETTVTFHPQSKEGQGLQQLVHRYTGNADRRGDTLAVGIEERFLLVKEP